MDGIVVIDTMYLSVRYPKADIYERWKPHVEGVPHRKLKEGVAVGDFVLKNGASGYKFSIWQHDARAYITPEVDEKLGDGKGMGIWLQLGPKFLIHHARALKPAVNEFLEKIGVNGEYETRITRIDIAIDLFNVKLANQDINLWHEGWVGRSKVSAHHFNSRTGELETINIGSRKSAVYVRVYDKIAQAIKEGDIVYWFDVWGGSKENLTRIEWEVNPREGNFSDNLQDFSKFDGFAVRELLNYLLDWGRLCVPDETDSNRNRWQDVQLWAGVRKVAEKWSHGVDWPTSRYGKEFRPVSEAYARFVSGVISGAQARFGKNEPSFGDMLEGLEKYGETHKVIQSKAQAKYKRLINL